MIMKRLIFLSVAVILLSCQKNETINFDGITDPVYGTVTWSDGSPASEIQISDGFTITYTDSNGEYSIENRNVYAQWVYYSVPADAKLEIGQNGLPCFYKALERDNRRYDFTLTKAPVENRFRLLAIGDPQVRESNNGIHRFTNETAPDIRDYVASKKDDMPTYAVALGDLVHNEWNLYPRVIEMLSVKSLSVPCFQVIGNHDHEFLSSDPIPDIRGQRKYEAAMGPVNYSFDRGQVHFVVLDNIVHNGKSETSCTEEICERVMAWVRTDLERVPKEKSVVALMHAQLSPAQAEEFFNLLSTFANARLVCGHLHYLNNVIEEVNGKTIHNDDVCTANGVDWCAQVAGGGEPMGYASYEFEGGSVKNQVYKATGLPEGYQIRLYRPSDFPAFKYAVQKDAARKYEFGVSGDDKIVANIWNATSEWSFEVYEDGVKTADKLENMPMHDAWSCWYFYMVLNKNTYSYSRKSTHMYYHTLVNPQAEEVRVVAKDPYGNTFEQNVFTTRNENDYPAIR